MPTTSDVATVTAPDALRAALGSGAAWLWFLAPGARPAGDALERLAAAVEPAGAPRATIVAGLVVDPHGRPRDQRLVADRRGDGMALLELVRRRLLPLRYVTFDHCLVARDAFDRHGSPDTGSFGPYAAIEWSARVLRDEAGYLVPASRVVREGRDQRPGRRALGATIRMSRTGIWTRGESLEALAAAVLPARRSAA